MPVFVESDRIQGVLTAEYQTFGDDRGRFSEIFRLEWFPQRPWQAVQLNRSESRAGVVRGLHYHLKQVDYWHCLSGHLRVGLYDLRQSSPTRGAAQVVDVDGSTPSGLYIPSGVAHGFLAVTDVVLIYVVDQYYDGADELGVAWNDPQLGLDWQARCSVVVSDRDRANPRLADIAGDLLPP